MSKLFADASACWQAGDYRQFIQILEKANKLDPANYKVVLNLGLASLQIYEYAAAERYFDKAIRLSGNNPEIILTAANHYLDFQKYDVATKFFERAAQQKFPPADTFAKLAEIAERQRKLDQATAFVDRALQIDPHSGNALIIRARLLRQSGQMEDAEKLLRSMLARVNLSDAVMVRVWYELGALLDRQGQYDDAMKAWTQGKAILRPQAGPLLGSMQAMQRHIREMIETVSDTALKRWHDALPELPPTHKIVLLCGHPRSGTTLLEQVLDAHPEIISAEETQLMHEEVFMPFARQFTPGKPIVSVLDETPVAQLQKQRANYFRSAELFFGQPIGSRLLLDKNPSITVALPMIARVFPEMKFIVALRDPRDICMSCFMQSVPLNPASVPWLTLESTVADYAAMMSLWVALKPRLANPAIEVRYEDMVELLEPVARRTLNFVGATWDDRVMRFDEHARNKTVRSPTYADVTKPIFKTAIGRWRNYQKYLEPHLDKLQPFLNEFGYTA